MYIADKNLYYQEKYNKYKYKYLQLKYNQTGKGYIDEFGYESTNIINDIDIISGPISIRLMTNGNKYFLLFGDQHIASNNLTCDYIGKNNDEITYLPIYLHKLFNNNITTVFDIFTEFEYKKDRKGIENYGPGLLNNVHKQFKICYRDLCDKYECSKLYPNVRFHVGDIRHYYDNDNLSNIFLLEEFISSLYIKYKTLIKTIFYDIKLNLLKYIVGNSKDLLKVNFYNILINNINMLEKSFSDTTSFDELYKNLINILDTIDYNKEQESFYNDYKLTAIGAFVDGKSKKTEYEVSNNMKDFIQNFDFTPENIFKIISASKKIEKQLFNINDNEIKIAINKFTLDKLKNNMAEHAQNDYQLLKKNIANNNNYVTIYDYICKNTVTASNIINTINTPKNIIIIAGEGHIENYVDFLRQENFKMEFEFFPVPHEKFYNKIPHKRCVNISELKEPYDSLRKFKWFK
jgi:hypothetical protein